MDDVWMMYGEMYGGELSASTIALAMLFCGLYRFRRRCASLRTTRSHFWRRSSAAFAATKWYEQITMCFF